jgi:hypothetical protein
MDMTKLSLSDIARITVLAASLATGDLAKGQTPGGSVNGKLINEAGQPLPGVTVAYRRAIQYVRYAGFHGRPAPGELVVAGTVTTGRDGTFSAADLPAGDYSLCLDNPPDPYVDHCDWNLSGAYFTIVVGTRTAMNPVTVISGVRIHFLISDPQGLLPTAARLEPTAHIGVATPQGIYRPAVVASRSGGVAELVITVPHTQAVSTSIFSRTLTFRDSSGAITTAAPVTVPQGATDHNISLAVSK